MQLNSFSTYYSAPQSQCFCPNIFESKKDELNHIIDTLFAQSSDKLCRFANGTAIKFSSIPVEEKSFEMDTYFSPCYVYGLKSRNINSKMKTKMTLLNWLISKAG